jgi:hypothetical protein
MSILGQMFVVDGESLYSVATVELQLRYYTLTVRQPEFVGVRFGHHTRAGI